VLSLIALVFGVVPFLPATFVLNAAVSSVYGSGVQTALALWHGVNVPLMLSGASLVIGSLLFTVWQRLQPSLYVINTTASRVGPEAGYFRLMLGITQVAGWQTRLLQNGVLGIYLLILVLVTFSLTGYTLLTRHGFHLDFDFSGGYFYEWGIALLIVASTVFASVTRSRLGSVASVGVLGFGVALIFIHFSDRDLAVAVFAGAVMTLLMLAVLDIQYFDSISSYYIENSYGLAFGKNIVNVILVDFRQLDTLGEIFVLALAAMGVYSMIKLRAEDQHKP
jgi:multicomponent Na+:H+ antiporter subunit A